MSGFLHNFTVWSIGGGRGRCFRSGFRSINYLRSRLVGFPGSGGFRGFSGAGALLFGTLGRFLGIPKPPCKQQSEAR